MFNNINIFFNIKEYDIYQNKNSNMIINLNCYNINTHNKNYYYIRSKENNLSCIKKKKKKLLFCNNNNNSLYKSNKFKYYIYFNNLNFPKYRQYYLFKLFEKNKSNNNCLYVKICNI